MKRRCFAHFRIFVICGLSLLPGSPPLLGQPTAAAVAAFNSYSKTVESRLTRQHESPAIFLAPAGVDPQTAALRLCRGEPILEQLTPSTGADVSGALLHHWRGTAFVPGARAADFERLMRDFNSYPQHFAPQVLQAGVLMRDGNRMTAWMRVRQRHVVTVVLDTTYDISFGRLDPQHGYSIAEHKDRRNRFAGRRHRARAQPGRGTRLSVAAEHLLELRGARRRTLPADRGSLPHALHTPRPGLGSQALRGEHPA